MINPKDCWHTPYFLKDRSVNTECKLFEGCSDATKKRYLEWCKQ